MNRWGRIRGRLVRAAVMCLAVVGIGTLPVPPTAAPSVAEAAPGGSPFDVRAEARLLELVNRIRVAAGLHRLEMTGALQAVARAHSQDMAIRGYVAHDQPGNLSVFARLWAAIPGSPAIAENIAVASTAEQAHRALVASPSHRRNILAPRFRWVGIGIAHSAPRRLIITEDFWE